MMVNEEASVELDGHTVVSAICAQREKDTLPNWHSTPAGKQHYLLDDLGGQRSGPVLLFLHGASTVPTFSQKRSTDTFITCCLKNTVIREEFIILAALALASVWWNRMYSNETDTKY